MFYDIFETKVGKIKTVFDGKDLIELRIEGDNKFNNIPKDWVKDSDVSKIIKNELGEYFDKKRKSFSIKIKLNGSEFQKLVWGELQKVKYGETISYSKLAQNIGKPKAVRAVASAVARNPICILIPCHRVILSNGKIGNYVAGVAKKKILLDLESII